ncbi:MAG: tripartite tricarboxylate transporter TctB family protein [Pseudolabrys sp.]|nr:tripartite tricarboxylate transporter TctB family protein [Pseudolabrys sp.]MDP2293871.1 tripartite tricarboxylate transporter TctB family protein [Pseudolabrys sp.]
MRRADIIGGVIMLIFSISMIFVIIPAETMKGQWTGLSPYFYPTVMSGGIGVFAIGLLAQAALRPRYYADQAVPLTMLQFGMFLIVTAIVFAGVLAIDNFGVWIGGAFTIAAIMLFMGERKPLIIVPTALAPIAVVYLVVTYVLRSPLP